MNMEKAALFNFGGYYCMKCSSCGLPLSPARVNANCPRCGAPPKTGSKSPGAVNPPRPALWEGNHASVPPGIGASLQDGQWGQGGQLSPSYNSMVAQAPVSHLDTSQAVQPGQLWLKAADAGAINQAPTAGFSSEPTDLGAPFRPAAPRFPRPPQNNRKTRIGFLVAGLCIVSGALLLVFVYFMAIGAGNNTSGNSSGVTQTVPSPTRGASPTTAPSPTATTYPGSQYLSNAQTNSTPPSGSQPGQPATTFKVNQQFYLSFNVHTGGQNGEVCLIWYLNGKQAFTSKFALGANTRFSYAYVIYGSSGPAYVELYWASNASCANQVLAQRVNFTITT